MSDAPELDPKPPNGCNIPLLLAATVVVLTLVVYSGSGYNQTATAAPPLPIFTVSPTSTVTPTATATPLSTPTPSPTAELAEVLPTITPYDFSQPIPESEVVDMTWFEDAAFIGDSRTDGLRLYSGIKGPDFFCAKGISVFDVMDNPDKKIVTIDDTKYTILEALALGTYTKVYISLGINELGYTNNTAFEETFAALLDEVARLQPDAVIYLQTLIPVNEAKCKANNQADYVTNAKVAVYNEIFYRLSEEKQVVLVDLATGLSDENGDLPSEATTDGVHFARAWYEAWAAYLMCHTADAASYFAGQTAN